MSASTEPVCKCRTEWEHAGNPWCGGDWADPRIAEERCKHGPMTYREHEGQRGWTCPLDKGHPDRCASVMISNDVPEPRTGDHVAGDESSQPAGQGTADGNRPELDKVAKGVQASRKAKQAGPPKPGVPTRAPKTQNEHMSAVLREVKKTTQHVAMTASVLLGRKLKSKFTTDHAELPDSIIADETGLTDRAVGTHMAKAVEAGLFRRVDNGKGGRSKSNSARYRAVVPDRALKG